MKREFAYLTSAVVFACAASAAHAELLDFDLTGSRSASFQLESNPTPNTSSSSVFGSQIQFLDVAGTYGGVAGTATIGFATGPIFADLNISNTPLLGFTQFAGPGLFTGTADAPVFDPGTFDLTSIVSGDSMLTISVAPDDAPTGAQSAAVPEPASWAMVLTGFGLAAFGLRRRPAPMSEAAA
jgi:hypothetical protein